MSINEKKNPQTSTLQERDRGFLDGTSQEVPRPDTNPFKITFGLSHFGVHFEIQCFTPNCKSRKSD